MIPSDITTPEQARHWCRVNGYSAEQTESMVAEWSAPSVSATIIPVSKPTPAPSPIIEEDDDEDDWDEDEDDSEE